jgi:hypothetical protein
MKDIERERLLIRQYLLGELDEHEREQLERRVITNPDYKQQVLITEEDLLDEFVNGTLSPHELESFTRMYSSSPAQRRKVKIAQALNRYALEHSPVVPQMAHRSWARSLIELFSSKNRFHQFSLAALILVLAVGSVLIYWLIAHMWSTDSYALRQLNQPNSEILQPSGSVVSVSLPPLLFRGTGENQDITITKQTQTVQLRLPDPSSGTYWFQAVLKDSERAEVFRLEDLRARQIDQHFVLVLQIPARMLKAQDYELLISEKRADGSYEPPSIYPVQVTESR